MALKLGDGQSSVKLPAGARDLSHESLGLRKEEGDDTVRLTFALASEEPVRQWWGTEILSHDKGAIRMDRAKRGAMPLLFNHNWDDPIGMIDNARVENKRLVVDAHLFNTDRAREVAQMLDGGLRNVSVSYRLHVIEERKDDDVFVATDWEPLEGSIVTVPADPTVGLGRAGDQQASEVRIVRASVKTADPATSMETHDMNDEAQNQAGASAGGSQGAPAAASRQDPAGAAPAARVQVTDRPTQASAVDLERARRRAIDNLCKMNSLSEQYRDHYVGTGMSIEDISDDILRVLEERGKTNPKPVSHLGLSEREAKQFSLKRAILACVDKDWSNAGFELECSREIAKQMNKPTAPTRFYVPFDVLQRTVDLSGFDRKRMAEALGRRDLTVATAGAGGYLVETDNLGFIDMLRNRSVAFRMGVRQLSGLNGNVTVPRQSAAATAYWLANEATAITESQQTFVQMALTPKTAGAYTELSRQLLLQSSPAAEGIVTDDLAQVVALAADLAVINGSGASGQPTGIINTAGVGAVTGTSLAFAGILEFQSDVATANVMPQRGGYVTTPAVAALLAARVKFTSTASPIWEGNLWDGNIQGFPAMTSNQMPAATMIFGDWQETVVGEWGVLEVETNPFANFQAGIIGVRAMYTLDVGVRRPFAYSIASSIT